MLKTKSSKLILTLLLVSVVALGAALSVSLLNLDNPNNVPDSNVAQAAITAASSFDKFFNGTKFYYTNPTFSGNSSVTVNTSAAHGSPTNPFVINTAAQWVLFAQVITNQTSGYTGTSKYFALGADIDFGGSTVAQVGRHGTGFQGTLYGNKHTIKNGTIQYTTYALNSATYACGLFHYTNGAKIFDVNLASTLQMSMKTDINSTSSWVHVGSLVAVMYNSQVIGCNSDVSIRISQTGTTSQTPCSVGGLIGHIANGGSNLILRCRHHGNVFYQTCGGDKHLGRDDIEFIGGLVGGIDGSTSIQQCASSGTIEARYAGDDIGGLIGRIRNTSTISITISDILLNVTVKATYPDASPGIGIIIGWDSGVGAWKSGSYVKNVYILRGDTYITDNPVTSYVPTGASPNVSHIIGWTETNLAAYSNIYCPVSSGLTIRAGAVNVDNGGHVTKSGSTSAVASAANSNTNITNNFTVTSSGGITSKNTTCVIDYDLAGGSWTGLSGAAKSYTIGASKTISQLGTKPTKKGFTFSKWSFDAAGSSTVSASTNFNSVSGNRTIYAI